MNCVDSAQAAPPGVNIQEAEIKYIKIDMMPFIDNTTALFPHENLSTLRFFLWHRQILRTEFRVTR